MTKTQKITLFLFRVSLGCMYFYAGFSKLINPEWTSQGYLESAKDPTGFYVWMAQSSFLPVVDFMNEWGLTLLGLSLIFGLFVRLSGVLGVLLMLLYYLALDFPYPNEHAFIVDEHIIYIFALLFLVSISAGRVYGLDAWVSQYGKLRKK